MDVKTNGGSEFDFGFERLDIQGKTARLELPVLWIDTVIVGKPANQANQPFFAAKVRSRSQRIASPLVASDASRAEDLDLFAKHVLIGWEGVYDRAKKPVPFSVGAARAARPAPGLRVRPDPVVLRQPRHVHGARLGCRRIGAGSRGKIDRRLIWNAKYRDEGDVRETLYEVRGAALPEWYFDRPALPETGPFFMQAFSDLSTCRQIGFGLGPIPWRDVVLYGKYHRFEGDSLQLFIDVIRELDRLYLDRVEKERKVEENAS